jgi:hypothetical protein
MKWWWNKRKLKRSNKRRIVTMQEGRQRSVVVIYWHSNRRHCLHNIFARMISVTIFTNVPLTRILMFTRNYLKEGMSCDNMQDTRILKQSLVWELLSRDKCKFTRCIETFYWVIYSDSRSTEAHMETRLVAAVQGTDVCNHHSTMTRYLICLLQKILT